MLKDLKVYCLKARVAFRLDILQAGAVKGLRSSRLLNAQGVDQRMIKLMYIIIIMIIIKDPMVIFPQERGRIANSWRYENMQILQNTNMIIISVTIEGRRKN